MVVSVQLSFEKCTSQLQVRSFTLCAGQKIGVFVLEEYKEDFILFSGDAML